MVSSSADRDPVERLAEEFLERHRRGEVPSLTDYLEGHPELADEIRELFPALLMMEGLKPVAGDVTGDFVDGRRAEKSRIPDRLGDFRILREVGRGGMGIVYEAEQESLGRHVALKVLPSASLLNPRHLQRFLREARAAARLHHTNIVPVFGVGEGDGLHYYVMQYIAGSGLHEVVEELKHLRADGQLTCDAVPGNTPTPAARDVALSLLTGHFGGPDPQGTTEAGPLDGEPNSGPPGSAARSQVSGTSLRSGSGREYAVAIARVGRQVADALGYAHNQGILHRDVKPSNLLLDVQGIVWVADFGLAKSLGESDNLTNEGDLIGTLRYMAPERFRGQADARSDLYALGLTLYEMLTLRPAFDETDRDRLIHQVCNEVPPRLRSINPEIPRDLETIVLKAIEPDPERRYQDADELAEDLGRFVEERPILARRVGAIERAWKWARRKPVVAGLLLMLSVSVLIGMGGITWQWRRAVDAWRAATINEDRAQRHFRHALRTVDTFCTQVSEEYLLEEPGMRPLRRRLLDLARRYYQDFQREHSDDPTLLKELALSFIRTGRIAHERGDFAEAHILLLRAKDLLIESYLKDPQDREIGVLLARCLLEVEYLDSEIDAMVFLLNVVRPITPVRRTISDLNSHMVLEGLVAAEPGNLDYQAMLGRSYDMLGIRDIRVSRFSQGEQYIEKAIETLRRVHQAAPENPEAARWLALSYINLGRLHDLIGYRAGCLEPYARALELIEDLRRRGPPIRRYRLDRAECLVELGGVLVELGRYREATAQLSEADAELRKLISDDPEAVDGRHLLGIATQAMGRAALAGGRVSEARRLLGESIEIHQRLSSEARSTRDVLALAQSSAWLGRVEIQAGHLDVVVPLRDRIRTLIAEIRERMLTGGLNLPVHIQAVDRLVTVIDGMGRWADAKNPAARIEARRAEVSDLQALSDRRPDNKSLRFDALWATLQLAELLVEQGRCEEARTFLDPAIPALEELTRREPEDLRWRQGLARAREALGRLELRGNRRAKAREAVAKAATAMEELAGLDPAYDYDLACVLALRSTIDTSPAVATSAIDSLRRAIGRGFDNAELLQTDPRLESLRSRNDFPAAAAIIPER